MNERSIDVNFKILRQIEMLIFRLTRFSFPFPFRIAECGLIVRELIDRRLFYLIYLIANAIAK